MPQRDAQKLPLAEKVDLNHAFPHPFNDSAGKTPLRRQPSADTVCSPTSRTPRGRAQSLQRDPPVRTGDLLERRDQHQEDVP